MKISNFSFFVTDDCNYDCSYCPQKKEGKNMKSTTVEKAVTFFYPFFKQETDIIFFGGEPLLTFDMVKQAVFLLEEKNMQEQKKLTFHLSTNGSLLTRKRLDFFDRHGFSILLSFDGLGQDTAREPGSQVPTGELIRRIQTYPGIQLSINCVFTPGTTACLSDSVRYIIASGGSEIIISPSCIQLWDEAALLTLENELDRLTAFLLVYYKEKGMFPVTFFRPPDGLSKKGFVCSGGRERLSVSPDENLWGCFVFHPYLKDKEGSDDFRAYSFGKLDDFIKNHKTTYPKILANYTALKQECFFTENRFCFLCKDKENCVVCPVDSAYATSFIGKIPPWYCSLYRTLRKAKEKFLERLDK